MQHELHDGWLEAMWDPHAGSLPDHARAELTRCPQCAGKVESMLRVQGALSRAASEEEEVLAAAVAMQDAQGVARAQSLLRQSGAGVATARAERGHAHSRRAWLVAAAVVLGVVSLVVWRAQSGGKTPLDVLGSQPPEAITPVGRVDDVDEFAWRCTLPLNGSCVVRVYRPGGSSPVLESPHVSASKWRPDADELVQIPTEFQWEVTVYDSTGKAGPSTDLVSVSVSSH